MKRIIPQKEGKRKPKNIPTSQRFTLSYLSFSVFSCRIFPTQNTTAVLSFQTPKISAEALRGVAAMMPPVQVWKSAKVDPFLRNDPFPTSLGNQPEEGSWKKDWKFFSNEITAKKCSPKKVSVAKKNWTANLFKCAVLRLQTGWKPFFNSTEESYPKQSKGEVPSSRNPSQMSHIWVWSYCKPMGVSQHQLDHT